VETPVLLLHLVHLTVPDMSNKPCQTRQ
jgi:hypothetical protein